MKSIFIVIRYFCLGFAVTIGVITLLIMALWSITSANGQEPNRSLLYVPPERVITEIVIQDGYDVYLNTGDTSKFECDKRNRRLLASIKMIAAQIAVQPDVGYIYAQAIHTIEGLWCNGN